MHLSQDPASLLDFFFYHLFILCHELHKTSLPPPQRMTSDPTLILPFSPFAKRNLERSIPCCVFSLHPPPPTKHHPAALTLCISFFFRDLPPQSHKSTEDRCLLCLIKALPPGVIPQFEQEEKPSEGGNVLDQSYEGAILYTLI